MKKPYVLVFSAILTALSLLPAFAAKEEASPDTAKAAPKRTAADEKKIAEERKRTQAARKDLNGTSWEVTLRAPDAKGKDTKDKFTFQDGMFKSDYYIGRGHTATNYTITMSGEKTEEAIWETMLTAKEGQIFIHGVWEKDKMRGNITEQLDGGKKVVERYFTTESRKAIPAESKKTDEKPATDGTSASKDAPTSLVSKEAGPEVTPFKPGTTDESR